MERSPHACTMLASELPTRRAQVRKLLAVIAVALLSACAATLDSAPTSTIERELAVPPEQVYGTVVRAMRSCYIGPQLRVEADYLPNAQTGDIRLLWANSVGVVEQLRLRVQPSTTGTKLTGVHRTAQHQFIAAVDAWLEGKPSPCPYA